MDARALLAAVATLALPVALTACGADAEEPAGASATANVQIAHDPDGSGREEAGGMRLRCPSEAHRQACVTLLALDPSVFEPVPERRACTMIFGGPATGRIEGRIRGRRVAARFSRQNGCEIRRYEQVAPLLRLADGVSRGRGASAADGSWAGRPRP